MHPIETPDKTFHDGDGVSELGTILPAWWLNQVQSELLAVLTAAGIQPDKSQPNQLLAALNKLAVVTTGNQDIGGSKTFTAAATFKAGAIVADSVGDFNANQYLQIGSNNVNSYFYNKRSGKYLSMRNDGELRYDGKRLLNVDDFISQKASSGYMKTPSGLILEWGTAQVPIDSYVQVVFPLAFPTACLNVQATAVFDQAVPGATVLSAHVGRVNQTGCHVGVSENGIVGPRPVYWLAIGH
jgi:putative tail fiber protein